MSYATGSSAGDLIACPPRAALPQAREPAGEDAERGNEIHAFCQALTLDPANREKYENAVSEEYRHTVKALNLDGALDGITVLGCEVAFVLNVKERTCRKIGVNIDRQYAKHTVITKYDVPFTVDIHGMSNDANCPVELDYKSGQSIGDVSQHGQRQVSSAGLMFFHGVDTSISRVCYIRPDGSTWPDGCEFSILDAWQICDELVIAIDAVDTAKAILTNGGVPNVFPDREKQCRYCSAFTACPYWNGLLARYLGKPLTVPTSSEEAGKFFDLLKDLEKVVEKGIEQLKKRAEDAPLVVDDRFEYRYQEKKGKAYFDASAARGLLVTALGRAGDTEEQINEKMASLQKEAKPTMELRKRKRELPVIKNTG